MPKDLFMTNYLQGDKNATFIIYVANSKQIPSAIGNDILRQKTKLMLPVALIKLIV